MKVFLLLFFTFFFSLLWCQTNTPVPNQKTEKEELNTQPASLEKSDAKMQSTMKKMESKSAIENFNEIALRYDQQWKSYSRNPYRRTLMDTELEELNGYLNRMTAQESKNFKSLLAFYQVGQHDIKRYEALKLAEKIAPSNEDVLKLNVAFFAITQKTEKEREYLLNLFRKGIYPMKNIDFFTDVISSVSVGGTLVVHGYEDYCGIRYVQLQQNKRKDVKVISLDFLNSSNYREQLKKLGFTIPAEELVDIQFLEKFCVRNENKDIHLSLTIAPPYLIYLKDKIYIKGLTAYFSRVTLDLYTENTQLWSKELNKYSLQQEKFSLNANYLPMLYQMRNGLDESAEKVQIQSAIQKIAEQLNLPEKVKSY